MVRTCTNLPAAKFLASLYLAKETAALLERLSLLVFSVI